MGYTCHGCRHGKPCVKEHMKRAEIVEAHADTLTAHATVYPPVPAPNLKSVTAAVTQMPVGPLTDEEIKAMHAPTGRPGALNTPCHCRVCDPAFHGGKK